MRQSIAIVLAAGKGTRMQSDLPKVLVPACGRPLIKYVLRALEQAGLDHILVVIGYRADDVRRALAHDRRLVFVEQRQQLGTGHAVQVCVPHLRGHDGAVLVVTGDSPLTQPSSLQALLDEYRRDRPACILGTLHKDSPQGLGRIVRGAQHEFMGIVEEKDATAQQQSITEVNMSTYVFHGPDLLWALGQLRADNAQGEYYITDCPGLLKAHGKDVRALPVLQPCEALSVNNTDDLVAVEAEIQRLNLV